MKDRFITISKARRILGAQAKNMSDQQIETAINILYEVSELCLYNLPDDQ